MLFSLFFPSITVSLYFMLFSLVIALYLLIEAINAQFFNSTAELETKRALTTKEAKAEIETHPVTIEAKINKCSIGYIQ